MPSLMERFLKGQAQNNADIQSSWEYYRKPGMGIELDQPIHFPDSFKMTGKNFRHYIACEEYNRGLSSLVGPQPGANLRDIIRSVLHSEARI